MDLLFYCDCFSGCLQVATFMFWWILYCVIECNESLHDKIYTQSVSAHRTIAEKEMMQHIDVIMVRQNNQF